MSIKGLNPEELSFYQEKGYIMVEDFLSESELEAIEQVVPRMTARLLEDADEKEHIFEKDEAGNCIALRCIHNLLEQDNIFQKFASKQKLLEIVSQVMSPNLYFYRGILVVKQRGIGTAFPWHQDFAYWGKGEPEMVGCWIALKDAGIENGCLDIIPGSHRWGVLALNKNDPGQPILTQEQADKSIPAPVKKGTAIIFHSLLVHKSNPNTTAEDRWAIVYEYSAPEFKNGAHRFDRHCGWDLKNGSIS